jgi:hypothetical protein
MRRGVPTGSAACEHGYQLSARGMHPDGRPCLPAGITEDGDGVDLATAIRSAPAGVLIDTPALDAHGLALHLLRSGYRFVDPLEKHVIEIRESDFTLKHPLSCRAADLFNCAVNTAALNLAGRPGLPGRYECTEQAGHLVLLERVA